MKEEFALRSERHILYVFDLERHSFRYNLYTIGNQFAKNEHHQFLIAIDLDVVNFSDYFSV